MNKTQTLLASYEQLQANANITTQNDESNLNIVFMYKL